MFFVSFWWHLKQLGGLLLLEPSAPRRLGIARRSTQSPLWCAPGSLYYPPFELLIVSLSAGLCDWGEEDKVANLNPWWVPQQRGRRDSFVGCPNLGLNIVSCVLACIVLTYLALTLLLLDLLVSCVSLRF